MQKVGISKHGIDFDENPHEHSNMNRYAKRLSWATFQWHTARFGAEGKAGDCGLQQS